MAEAPQVFTLIINGQPNEFKSATFSRVSRKAHQLMKEGIYEETIDKELSEDSADAFVKACRLQNFKVTSANAFDLLDLSIEWKIVNLEKFVEKYCKTKGLTRPEPEDSTDYLAIFMEKMSQRTLEQEDYINVAKRINQYITDERMLKIHTLPLFRLILASEYTPVDDQKLVEFVMKIIKVNPNAAVPLLLRVNYDLLTPEEDDTVFDTPQTHEQNINFFIASSCSATRNRTFRILQAIEQSIQDSLNETSKEAKVDRHNYLRTMNEDYRKRVNEMKEIVDRQKQQIEDLKKYREIMITRRQEVENEFKEKNEELDNQRSNVSDMMDHRRDQNEALKAQVGKEIGKQAGQVRQKVLNDFDTLKDADEERRESGAQYRQNSLDSLKRNVERMKKNCQVIKAEVTAYSKETEHTRAILAAKMVKDFMRFDNFIRKTERRHKIFDERSIWNLSSAEVKSSEEELNVIERRIDKICPIRHTLTK